MKSSFALQIHWYCDTVWVSNCGPGQPPMSEGLNYNPGTGTLQEGVTLRYSQALSLLWLFAGQDLNHSFICLSSTLQVMVWSPLLTLIAPIRRSFPRFNLWKVIWVLYSTKPGTYSCIQLEYHCRYRGSAEDTKFSASSHQYGSCSPALSLYFGQSTWTSRPCVQDLVMRMLNVVD